MKFSVALLTAVALVIAPHSEAQEYTIKFLGSASCGSWPKMKPYGALEKAVPTNLVLGFLAGRSSIQSKDTLLDVDIESVSAWMDNYCSANPLDTIITGALALEKELIARLR